MYTLRFVKYWACGGTVLPEVRVVHAQILHPCSHFPYPPDQPINESDRPSLASLVPVGKKLARVPSKRISPTFSAVNMSQARKRKSKGKQAVEERRNSPSSDNSQDILPEDMTATSSVVAALRRQPVWIVLAVSSGACAAFNGVFAKLYVHSLSYLTHLRVLDHTLLSFSSARESHAGSNRSTTMYVLTRIPFPEPRLPSRRRYPLT